jgi:hypothetical protein
VTVQLPFDQAHPLRTALLLRRMQRSTVKIAKADQVPTDANLLPGYGSFAALEAACAAFCEQVSARCHRVTRRAPAQMLAGQQRRRRRRWNPDWSSW